MTTPYRDLLRSPRVSTATRAALEARAQPDDPRYLPTILSGEALETLRAVLALVIPQSGFERIDLAARIDRRLTEGGGDGWRFAALPADCDAYRVGLGTLSRWAVHRFGLPYGRLTTTQQAELLSLMAARREEDGTLLSQTPRDFTHAQLCLWFEDVRADAVRLYVGAPRTLERIGYSGIANGGDGMPKSGFVQVGLDQREDWEPLPAAGAPP